MSWKQAVGFAVGLAMLGLPSTAWSADARGGFAVHGVGAALCKDVTEAAKANQDRTVADLAIWIGGYLSAHNRLVSNIFDIVPTNEMPVYARLSIANCERNQELRFETVVASLLRSLEPLRVREDSPFVVIRNDRFLVSIRSSMVRDVQAALIRARHLTGTADGVWGERSEAALRKFQEQAKIAVTGVPDVGTLSVLLAPAR